MMRLTFMLSLTAFAATLALAEERGLDVIPTAPEISAPELQYHLLAIGIDQYAGGWPKLETAVHGAEDVAAVLKDTYGFRNDHVSLLLNSEATRSGIYGALRDLGRRLGEKDALVVYFAGHGQLDDFTAAGYWVPADAVAGDPATYIPNSEIKNILRATKARHVLLVSDSCFAGDFFSTSRGAPEITSAYVRRAVQLTSRLALTSGGLEPVSDSGLGGHSIFTHFLLKALREPGQDYLLPSELYMRIRNGVGANARQDPKLGLLEGTGGEIGGELVLIRRSAGGNLETLLEKKNAELTYLQQREEESHRAAQEQQKLLDEKSKALADLDQQIEDMRKRLGTGGETEDGSLDQLFALVQQKEQQGRELKALQIKKDEETKARETEIIRLRTEENAKRKTAFEADYTKYTNILASTYADDGIKKQAWKAISAKWQVADAENEPRVLVWNDDSSRPVSGTGQKLVVDLGNGVHMELVWIKPGTFTMGSPDNEPGRDNDEGPQHRVTISQGFWMGKTEVTQKQYQQLIGNNPSSFKNVGPDAPVDKVTWHDATNFCGRIQSHLPSDLRGRRVGLPTEAEWEYACRADTITPFFFGACLSTDQANYDGNYPMAGCAKGQYRKSTVPVNSFPDNTWGLYDMHDNVREWCQDGKRTYSSSAVTDPGLSDTSGSSRVLRGGSWFYDAKSCRSANRYELAPGYQFNYIGFRVVVR